MEELVPIWVTGDFVGGFQLALTSSELEPFVVSPYPSTIPALHHMYVTQDSGAVLSPRISTD